MRFFCFYSSYYCRFELNHTPVTQTSTHWWKAFLKTKRSKFQLGISLWVFELWICFMLQIPYSKMEKFLPDSLVFFRNSYEEDVVKNLWGEKIYISKYGSSAFICTKTHTHNATQNLANISTIEILRIIINQDRSWGAGKSPHVAWVFFVWREYAFCGVCIVGVVWVSGVWSEYLVCGVRIRVVWVFRVWCQYPLGEREIRPEDYKILRFLMIVLKLQFLPQTIGVSL